MNLSVHKPAWIIFDVGGVMLDWAASSTATAQYLGVTHDELFDVLFDQTVKKSIGVKMNLGEVSAHDGWTVILKELKKDHAPEDIISRWYAKEFWLEDTLKLITELHGAGYKLAIMSNSWIGLTDPTKKMTFPKEIQLFDKIFDSSIEGVEKPEAKFYEVVEQRVGAAGKDLFFIDDDKKNLAIAEQREWQTFYYAIAHDDGRGANQQIRQRLGLA